MTEKKSGGVVKVGPPVDEREDDGRKHDRTNETVTPELEGRAKFLADNPVEGSTDSAKKSDAKKEPHAPRA